MVITGSMLRKMRLKAELTQKELANLIDVTQAHISKIELGKVDPRLSTVNKILEVLTEGKKRKCRDLMTHSVLFAKPKDRVLKVSEVMVNHDISQMPVIDGSKVIGTITEESIIRNLGSNIADEKIRNVMSPPLPTVSEETTINVIRPILEKNQGVLIVRDRDIVGIITRSDLLKTIE